MTEYIPAKTGNYSSDISQRYSQIFKTFHILQNQLVEESRFQLQAYSTQVRQPRGEFC